MGDKIYVVISLYEYDIQVIAQDWGGAKVVGDDRISYEQTEYNWLLFQNDVIIAFRCRLCNAFARQRDVEVAWIWIWIWIVRIHDRCWTEDGRFQEVCFEFSILLRDD